MPVPDSALAGERRHFEILRELEAIGGARVFAKAAEHAARSVVGECGQHLAARGIVTLPTNHNQVLRARQRAQIARDTQRFACLRIDIQPRRSAIPLRNHRPLKGILLGVIVFGSLIPERDPHALQQVEEKNPPQQIVHREVSVPSSPSKVKAPRRPVVTHFYFRWDCVPR